MDESLERRRHGMTAEAWPTSADPWAMLQAVLRFGPSERKALLYNVALLRRPHVWNRLPPESQRVVLAYEQRADQPWAARGNGFELGQQANAVLERLDRLFPDKVYPDEATRLQREAAAAVCYLGVPGDLFAAGEMLSENDPAEAAAQAEVVRELFGDRYRGKAPRFDQLPSSPEREDAQRLAQRIYDLHAFELCHRLAEELAAAGCADDSVLSHLRGNGPHVRGCWALDWVLGRK